MLGRIKRPLWLPPANVSSTSYSIIQFALNPSLTQIYAADSCAQSLATHVSYISLLLSHFSFMAYLGHLWSLPYLAHLSSGLYVAHFSSVPYVYPYIFLFIPKLKVILVYVCHKKNRREIQKVVAHVLHTVTSKASRNRYAKCGIVASLVELWNLYTEYEYVRTRLSGAKWDSLQME